MSWNAEHRSAIALSRDDDLSSILAPTEALLKALDEFSDEEEEFPTMTFKVLFSIS